MKSETTMQFDVITMFPSAFLGPLEDGVFSRARKKGRIAIRVHDLRRFGLGVHRKVDDVPYGGGAGMVLRPEPLISATRWVRETYPVESDRVVALSPQGRCFDQALVEEAAKLQRIVFLCGRYEGIDERVCESVVDEEWSVGDFVLSGGEPAAIVMMDAIARFVPEVLGNDRSAREDSFGGVGLDHPHYTRPSEYEGMEVPPVLMSGDHKAIRRWRQLAARQATKLKRPDLLSGEENDDECDSDARK